MRDPATVKKPFMGLDPGSKSGGIAVVSPSGKYAEAWPMPETQTEIIHLLKALLVQVEYAVVEKVNAMPKQGVVSTWNFSGNYHTLTAVLRTLVIPVEEIRPHEWKRKLGGLVSGKDDKKTKKALARLKAQSMFPDALCHNKRGVIDDRLADALLLAEFCRRLRRGL